MSVVEKPKTDAHGQALTSILAAAEQEFAERGFDGAGMKALAARANVSQSLLHYHFGSKGKLYAAVIQNRSKLINAQRLDMLGKVDTAAPDALEQVFRALFAPALGPSGGGRAYARIFAGLIAGNARDQDLVRDNYDATAQTFIAVLQSCLPGISVEDATQIYLSALGVLATSLARDGRLERLAGAAHRTTDDTELITRLIRFAVGGARAFQKG